MKAKDVLKSIEKKLQEIPEEKIIQFVESVGSLSLQKYSPLNQIAILAATDFEYPVFVMGYATWKKYGRQVKKGEHGIPILAPIRIKVEKEDGTEEEKLFFKVVYVFTEKQVEVVDSGKELPQLPQLTGDARLLYKEVKAKIENDKGIPVIEKKMYGTLNGYTDGTIIYINADLASAHKLKTLIHEYTHVLRENATDKEKKEEEIIAETSSLVFLSSCGIDASAYSIAYIKAWSIGKKGGEVRKALTTGIAMAERIKRELLEKEKVAA